MDLEFRIEDCGTHRKLFTRGPHTHESSKGAAICKECCVELPFSEKFIRKLIEWDRRGVFHFIGERLCNDSFNAGPRNIVSRFCADLNGAVVLDFGAGLGQLTPFFFERGASQVLLADIDRELMELSKTYLEDLGYGEKCKFFLIEEGDQLPMIEDESTDLIVASEVFEHILPQYRKQTLRVLYRKLKPGGIIVVTAPNRLFPKDMHTTDLWFTAWLPPALGARYARTFSSWRWKGRSTEDLLRQGLIQYSYFEAKRVLKPLGARDFCSEFPVRHEVRGTHRTWKGRLFFESLNLLFAVFLRHIGPWEAWQPALEMAWAKPAVSRRAPSGMPERAADSPRT